MWTAQQTTMDHQATCLLHREKKRLEAEALARLEREEEEARLAAEAAAAAERWDTLGLVVQQAITCGPNGTWRWLSCGLIAAACNGGSDVVSLLLK